MNPHLFRTVGFGLAWMMFATNTLTAVEVRPPLENKITQALKKRLAVNFQAVPLADAIKHLATEAGVPYRLDLRTYEENAVKSDTPVTLQRDEQEIAETLCEILNPLGLSYDPHNGPLTVMDFNDQILCSRFFDVSRLVELIKPRLTTEPIVDSSFHPGGGFAGGRGFFGAIHDHADQQSEHMVGLSAGDRVVQPPIERKAGFRVPLKDVQHRFPAEHCLMALIQENTSGQWEEIDMVGGTMTASPGRILMRQTNKVQQEAFDVLSNLEMMLTDLSKYPRLRLGESEEARRVRAALDHILDTVSDAPAATMSLQKWMDQNVRANGVTIRVDQYSLDDEAINWNEVKITLAPGESRRKLFVDALDQAHLSLVFFNGRFVITSLAKADEALSTMAYNVSHLPEAGDFDWLAEFLYQNTSGQWEPVDGVGGTATNCGIAGLLIVRQTEKVLEEIAEKLDDLRHPLEIPAKPLEPARTQSIYALPDVVMATDLQTVLPRLVDLPQITWPESSIQRVGSLLVIQQTEVAHRRIETVVEALLKAHKISAGIESTPPVASPETGTEAAHKP